MTAADPAARLQALAAQLRRQQEHQLAALGSSPSTDFLGALAEHVEVLARHAEIGVDPDFADAIVSALAVADAAGVTR